MKLKYCPNWSVGLGAVAALRCGKAVQMHYQFVAMHCHCQLHCLYCRIRKQNVCQQQDYAIARIGSIAH